MTVLILEGFKYGKKLVRRPLKNVVNHSVFVKFSNGIKERTGNRLKRYKHIRLVESRYIVKAVEKLKIDISVLYCCAYAVYTGIVAEGIEGYTDFSVKSACEISVFVKVKHKLCNVKHCRLNRDVPGCIFGYVFLNGEGEVGELY